MPLDPATQQIARTERDVFLGPSKSERKVRSDVLSAALADAQFSPQQLKAVSALLRQLVPVLSQSEIARNQALLSEFRAERIRLLNLGALPSITARDFELLQLLGANMVSTPKVTIAQMVLSPDQFRAERVELRARASRGPTVESELEPELAQLVSLLRQQGADVFAVHSVGEPASIYFFPFGEPAIVRERSTLVDWRVSREREPVRLVSNELGVEFEVKTRRLGTPRRRWRGPPAT